MTDDQVARYDRQIRLPGFGPEGQQRLASAQVLIVGLGGLGSPVAMYLAAAGVGHLIIADFDAVDASNLPRQILHANDCIGRPKVDSAHRMLTALNPEVRIETIKSSLHRTNLPGLASRVDLVIDASDNFGTRFLVNEACHAAAVPLVSGAAIRTEGQVTVFSGRPGGPCYQCLYPRDIGTDETCAVQGVLGPMVGIIGCIQATEAIKILVGLGEPLYGRLLLLDALTMTWRQIRLTADPACAICGDRQSPSG
ncbi:molybdopterin-synthase adenylyltransferase MoeB [Thioalkalicoccus limnaeus]|uniref:Molybdopterin-synthase adenylyltransferase MoeB n=1 Tax=Thioalkalicoccus limnaeus TaxID=120681 RepID=A0ABV4BER1_9GAMM